MTLTLQLKYLRREKDGRLYVRRNGKSIRLTASPTTGSFLAEYNAALAQLDGERPKLERCAKGSFSWLCQQYFQSREWDEFAPATRTGKRGILEAVCWLIGDTPVALIEARHIKKLRDGKKGAGAANKRLKVLRRLFQWAVEEELLSRNPAANVTRVRSKSTGYHSWTIEEVRQFEQTHAIGTRPRLALALLLYTGARRGDVVRMGPEMVKDGWMSFVTDKNGMEVTIPISPDLQQHINLCDRSASTYLQTAHGRPFAVASFGNVFRDWCNAAGLQNCSAHGLRKAGAALAAERGATEAELNAIFGWGHGSKEASVYVKAASRKVLSGRAAELISVPRN
jgi:integrase